MVMAAASGYDSGFYSPPPKAVPWSSTVATHDDWEEIGASVASSRWRELLDQLIPTPPAGANADAAAPTLSVLLVKQV